MRDKRIELGDGVRALARLRCGNTGWRKRLGNAVSVEREGII